ncbi:LAGLIDADG family homing endonuclease [Nanoarchaeota archaeon]
MRIKLKKGKQKNLISRVKNNKKFTWDQFSKYLGVSVVALVGWAKERNLLPLEVYKKLVKEGGQKEKIVEFKPNNWGQIKAGLISKGSLKEIKIPEKSKELAELVGIILGDGNLHYFKKGKKIGSYMLRIAGDKRHDYDYLVNYVSNLIINLFGVRPKIDERKSNEMLIIVHSKKLLEFLFSMGLKPGNKIKSKVSIPKWIFEDSDYLKSCVRGLIDTDGCIYSLKPKYPNYYQISFKNNNLELLKDLRTAFLRLGYPISKISCYKQIYLSQQKYLRKFYKDIGFSNKKHIKRCANSPVV